MGSQLPDRRGGLVAFGVILALGLVISTNMVSKTVLRTKLTNQTITVKGYAEKEITSDWGSWYGEFSTRSANLTDGYAKLEGDLAEVQAYLEKTGVAKDAMDISAVHTTTLYKRTEKGQQTHEIEGYRLSRSVSVSTSDVQLISKLARESTALIKQGVEFSSGSPSYIYTKIDDLKIEMLGAATKDARRRAEVLASNSGSRVGKLRSASQGVFQITSAYSTEVSDYGRYDTSSIDKSIKAVVTVRYTID